LFEIVGLVIAIILFFLLSALVSIPFTLIAGLLLRRQAGIKKLWIPVAAVIPPASAAYMLLCALVFVCFVPGATDRLFFDIKEPLPNGYVLKGLSKMPDFGYIDRETADGTQPQLLGGIARLDVDGPLVFGEYSHRSDSFDEPVPDHIKYFIFDTHTRQILNLRTLSPNDPYSGHALHLSEPELFRSREPSQIVRRRIEDCIYLGPPIVVTIAYFLFLILIRKKSPQAIPNPATC
jgi:hypothetical protein